MFLLRFIFALYFRHLLRLPNTVRILPQAQGLHMPLPECGENKATPWQRPPIIDEFLVALILTSIQDSILADWAAQTFFLLGGDVKISADPMSPASSFVVHSPVNLNSTPSNFQNQQSYLTFTSPDTGFNLNAISTPQMAPYSGNNKF